MLIYLISPLILGYPFKSRKNKNYIILSIGTTIIFLSIIAHFTENRKIKSIKPNLTTRFFSANGKPLLTYYLYSDGKIEFFNTTGSHPRLGVELKLVDKKIAELSYNYLKTGRDSMFITDNISVVNDSNNKIKTSSSQNNEKPIVNKPTTVKTTKKNNALQINYNRINSSIDSATTRIIEIIEKELQGGKRVRSTEVRDNYRMGNITYFNILVNDFISIKEPINKELTNYCTMVLKQSFSKNSFKRPDYKLNVVLNNGSKYRFFTESKFELKKDGSIHFWIFVYDAEKNAIIATYSE
jgi:hypothetical protein